MIKESGHSMSSRSMVLKLYRQFKVWQESIDDDERCSRSESVKSTAMAKVKRLIHEDRRFTVRNSLE